MPESIQSRLGDYQIIGILTPDQSWHAVAPGGRQVVLKLLDPDCMQGGQLHPNIHSRLARVRELAHPGIANLLGVERISRDQDSAGVFAIWEYIAGETLDRHTARLGSSAELVQLAREIVLAVQSLHALGIVHGRIHAGNLIIDAQQKVKLTHVSPLLYHDPEVDVHDLAGALSAIAVQRGWIDCELTRAIESSPTLAQLRGRLSALPNESAAQTNAIDRAGRSLRRRAIAAAILTAAGGAAFALLVLKMSGSSSHGKAIPPEAPSQAMQRN